VANSGSKKIIFNLAYVNYIDRAGVGELMAAYTSVCNQGGKLKLLNLTKKLHQVPAITKLLIVFDVFDNEKTAVAQAAEFPVFRSLAFENGDAPYFAISTAIPRAERAK